MKMSDLMPAIFFGHGNPMNAISTNGYTEAWAKIGRNTPKPKSILCISAHWYIPGVALTSMGRPRTIHDFGGFPRELFAVEYPAPGSRDLADRVNELLGGDVLLDANNWGLDHGTWSVLVHVFPDADIPVVQLSLDRTKPASWHYDLARRLAPLRDEGVLVIGSGNLVHNLRLLNWAKDDAEPFDWAVRFEAMIRQRILADDHAPLVNYDTPGGDGLLAAPTPEHYLPLLYILGIKRDGDEIAFPVSGFVGGSISMLSVKIG